MSVELRFIAPDLRRLDQVATEVLAVPLASDERPPRGAAGLVDWRLAGMLSRVLCSDFVTGTLGEVVLMPGRPKLGFDKILLFGVGAQSGFDEGVFEVVVGKMLSTLEGLKARTAVVDLPGRRFGGITAERAVDLLLAAVRIRPYHDLWTLIEPSESHKLLADQVLRERRRQK